MRRTDTITGHSDRMRIGPWRGDPAVALLSAAGQQVETAVVSGDPAHMLAEILESHGCDAVIMSARGGGLRAAVLEADPTDRIVVFGSFHTVGGVLKDGVPRLAARHLAN